MKPRRINLYGGPAAGKSTMSFFVAWKLKEAPFEADLIKEPIKVWTYLDRAPTGYSDQQFLSSVQMQDEEVALRKLEVVVTDAPLLMHCYYGWKFDRPGWRQEVEKANLYEEKFPSLNIYLHRGDWKYSGIGRYQTEDQAKEMDGEVHAFLKSRVHLYEMSGGDYSSILRLLAEKGYPCKPTIY